MRPSRSPRTESPGSLRGGGLPQGLPEVGPANQPNDRVLRGGGLPEGACLIRHEGLSEGGRQHRACLYCLRGAPAEGLPVKPQIRQARQACIACRHDAHRTAPSWPIAPHNPHSRPAGACKCTPNLAASSCVDLQVHTALDLPEGLGEAGEGLLVPLPAAAARRGTLVSTHPWAWSGEPGSPHHQPPAQPDTDPST